LFPICLNLARNRLKQINRRALLPKVFSTSGTSAKGARRYLTSTEGFMSRRAAIPACVSILLAGALSAFAAAPAAKTDSLATKQISLAAADTAKARAFWPALDFTTPPARK